MLLLVGLAGVRLFLGNAVGACCPLAKINEFAAL